MMDKHMSERRQRGKFSWVSDTNLPASTLEKMKLLCLKVRRDAVSISFPVFLGQDTTLRVDESDWDRVKMVEDLIIKESVLARRCLYIGLDSADGGAGIFIDVKILNLLSSLRADLSIEVFTL